MKISVLSSGSKGNTTYISSKKAKILIDLGNTSKYVKERLEDLKVDPNSIDAILITHIHVDHVGGLKTFIKKYNIKVYITESMLKSLDYLDNYEIIDDEFYIKDMHINCIKTSHDTPESRGFVISSEDKSIVYITDTGYINKKYFDILKNRDLYVIESNHDIEMLNNGSYPFHLRQRILSDKGHLSNYDCSKYLSKFIGNKTKYILLAHLSNDNNTKELAYETLINRLNKEKKVVDNIIITSQNKETELIKL